MQTTGGFMKCNFKLKSHNRSKEFRRRYFKFLPLHTGDKPFVLIFDLANLVCEVLTAT